jgi:soluble lytic murein transglycosylase
MWSAPASLSLTLLALCASCSQRDPLRHDRPETDLRDGGQARDAAAGHDANDGVPRDADQDTDADEASWDTVISLVRMRDDLAALDALAHLTDRGSPGANYLRARILERLGRHGEAADALDIDADLVPRGVAADIELRRAMLQARAGRCREARPALLRLVARPGPLSRECRTLAARCALDLGAPDEAVRELRALVAAGSHEDDQVEVRRSLADALARSGNVTEAREILRGILLSSPEHPGAAAAEARLRELGRSADFTPSERLARTERLLDRRRFDAALIEVDSVARPTRPGLRARWLHLRGMALFQTRHHYAEAADVLAESARLGGPTAIDDEFHAARALSRADRDDEAIAAYVKFHEAHPNHESAALAEYLAAWLDIRHGRARGEQRMERFLGSPRARKAPDLGREAAWHLAFRAFERGQHKRAVPLFERYARMGRLGLVRGRGLYWKARALQAQGRRIEAVETYRAAISVEPLHWYALLACQRLDALGESPGPPFARAPRAEPAPPALPAPRLPPEVAFYLSVGLDDDAIAELRGRDREVLAGVPRGRETEALATAYRRVGGYRQAFLMVAGRTDDLDRPPDSWNRWVWEAAFPRPLSELVGRASAERGVEPALVYAIMRQESGYAPGVVSRADAIGLLQMLPATAETLSAEVGVTFRRELLFDPAWNISFGVAEIGQLHRSFDARLPLTVATYNAGAPRVRRWLDETGEVDLDLFVERIPFDETRNYVRRVTTHYARYRYLEDPSRPWPVDLPARVAPRPVER